MVSSSTVGDDSDARSLGCAVQNRHSSGRGSARVMRWRAGEGAGAAPYDNDKRLWIPWIGLWVSMISVNIINCIFLRRESFPMWETWQLKLRRMPKNTTATSGRSLAIPAHRHERRSGLLYYSFEVNVCRQLFQLRSRRKFCHHVTHTRSGGQM